MSTDDPAPEATSFRLDPGLLPALLAIVEETGVAPEPETSVDAMRRGAEATFPVYSRLAGRRDDVTWRELRTPRSDAEPLVMRWYVPTGRSMEPGPAAVYVHGGGMVSASVANYHGLVARYVGESGVPLLAVEYSLAPEHRAPAAAEDVVTALRWLHENADALRVDGRRVALMGDSGGGGIAAAAALMLRDHGAELGLPPLAAQILAYPMLDDRTTVPDPMIAPFVTWSYQSNTVAWDAVRGGQEPGPDGYISPARAADLSGLPPTYLDVGELDVFRAEIVRYAQRLWSAGVSTELHVHPGEPHAFEVAAPHLPTAQRVLADRYRALASF